MLPVALSETGKVSVPADRAGAVLTVYLPGSAQRPHAARVVAALALDDRGRLSVTAAARAELGWESGTDLMISHDPDRCTLDIWP